ncbi:MAG: entericidin A/B family lipoprotein [Sulfuricellaceae bacterium]
MTLKKLIMLVAIASAMVLNLGGCNTVKGVGKDIEQGGTAIQKAVK